MTKQIGLFDLQPHHLGFNDLWELGAVVLVVCVLVLIGLKHIR
jgi:hypothetical protein